jgi:hypothetical protein
MFGDGGHGDNTTTITTTTVTPSTIGNFTAFPVTYDPIKYIQVERSNRTHPGPGGIYEYWHHLPLGQNFTYAQKSFYAKYAFCRNINKFIYEPAYKEYYKGTTTTSTHMGVLSSSYNSTNIQVENPLNCYATELWQQTVSGSAIFVSYMRKLNQKSKHPHSISFSNTSTT